MQAYAYRTHVAKPMRDLQLEPRASPRYVPLTSMGGRSRYRTRKWIQVVVNGNIAGDNVHVVSAILRDIAIDYNVYSLRGFMAQMAIHTFIHYNAQMLRDVTMVWTGAELTPP